jgi:sugar O-acyltransferase (sialic acid O-acetyltransferase NeuD family)
MPAARIGIIGYGVLGRHLEQFIVAARGADAAEWVRFDDVLATRGAPGAAPFAEHTDPRFADCDMYVALGYRHLATKEAIVGNLARLGRSLPALVHPTAVVDPTATIGPGVVVFPGCTIGSGVTLSPGVLLHCAVTLAHDDLIGAATYIGPGATLSGFVAVGDRSFIGTGVVIANGVTVGADSTVGIGTCVTRDVEAGSSVIGNPMRVLRGPLELK